MTRIKKHNVDNQQEKTMTVEELLNSGLIGIWKDRTDIKDNVEFARELREKAWARKLLTHPSVKFRIFSPKEFCGFRGRTLVEPTEIVHEQTQRLYWPAERLFQVALANPMESQKE